jgi:6-phosphogluconolactonase (cycloisomerase 2 family)
VSLKSRTTTVIFLIKDDFLEDRIFLLHELSARLTLQKIPPIGSTQAQILADVSIVPSDGPSNPVWAAAEVLIPPPTAQFPTPYIYVSNRNKGRNRDPRGDTIAIFEHVNKDTSSEGLRLVKQIYTGLDLVRGMAFGPKGSDEFLIAGSSEGSKGTAVFQRIDGGRDLKLLARETSVGTRTSYLWLP